MALVAHVVVDTDPDLRRNFEAVKTNISGSNKLSAFAMGKSPHTLRMEALKKIADYANDHAYEYSNEVGEIYSVLKYIDPSIAAFKDGSDFYNCWTKLKNGYDSLLSYLDSSGRNTGDEIQRNSDAEDYARTNKKLPLFYTYLLWKNQPLTSSQSNSLPVGVGMATGITVGTSSSSITANAITSSTAASYGQSSSASLPSIPAPIVTPAFPVSNSQAQQQVTQRLTPSNNNRGRKPSAIEKGVVAATNTVMQNCLPLVRDIIVLLQNFKVLSYYYSFFLRFKVRKVVLRMMLN